jgi:hypothetical protein
MSSDNTPIPNKALRRFERVEGIPLPVINELFFRMQMPENLQQAFWEQVAAKEWKEFTGRVQAISPPYTFFLLNDDMELHRNR